MLVKICGITTEEAAIAAVEAGADFIGFVFTKSKRQIELHKAVQIARHIPENVKKVGVFVNQTLDEMMEIAKKVNLDVIQLHGDEDTEVAASLPYEIVKAFPATEEMLQKAKDYPADYILIDAPSETVRGGSGKTANWDLIKRAKLDKHKLILAGGLHADNVQAAINMIEPVGVDVSSGVESGGKKDYTKIKQFTKQAKYRKDA